MFGFFRSDSRGSAQPAPAPQDVTNLSNLSSLSASKRTNSKRSRICRDGPDGLPPTAALAKRARLESDGARLASLLARDSSLSAAAMDGARDVIRHQFGLEVLLKHNELRLINQELSKCQVALEQLRRCHLILYPQYCPTPDQMLDISSGKGPALAAVPGEPVPRWAPPFGVVDGPYARHYAKWLIPDPSFDGVQPEWQFAAGSARARPSVNEGRATRNSFATDPGTTGRGRPVRGAGGQKLQALSSGYPQAKDKAGPCILKRADGKTVKLVCLDCKRENFSSTQGFINHCRIAHKRDFKSHEEAAVQSGQPVDVTEPATAAGERKLPVASSTTALVHPLARQDMTEHQAYAALRARIQESLNLYRAGKLPGVDRIPFSRGAQESPGAKSAGAGRFDSASETPHLSRLMEARSLDISLQNLVADAKTKVSLEDLTPDEESDDTDSPAYTSGGANNASQASSRVAMRVPARSRQSPTPTAAPGRPESSKGRPPAMPLDSPTSGAVMSKRASNALLSDEDMEIEDANLSPNTVVSNNAPSLVSDDGYDDSDEGSSVAGASDHLEDASMSDVAEITLDDEHEPRALRRGSSGVAVRIRRDDSKQVDFVSPVKNSARHMRPRRV